MVKRVTKPSLLQLLHQIELYPEELLKVLGEEHTTCMLSIVTKSKRIHQMLSLFPNKPVLEWKSSSSVRKGHFIPHLKAMRLVSKGCVYHLVRVNDSGV
ncbi:hypothetical protein H5410_045749 [Solanum commersonii]|uniref:Uncharacterized protein n=1 Tax=Solanum commersonii TaxID=4109 RepID=A0A9J5XAE9_SOLCO|nr:hypothetical protein H5410_045749 [Solanum commersonii]